MVCLFVPVNIFDSVDIACKCLKINLIYQTESVFGVTLVHIFPVFSRIRTEYGEMLRISPYSVRMREIAGKMRTRITLNTDTFCAMIALLLTFVNRLKVL